MTNPILITKADGTEEAFDVSKLEHSLERAGASREEINEVTEQIGRELVPGMTTANIYRRAFSLLKKMERPVASRYSMRRAVLDLGPTGFPFEKFVAEMFKRKGFETKTGVTLPGKCVAHEVDVIARKGNECWGFEMKFHNKLGLRTDSKVALYVRARFDDLQNAPKDAHTCTLSKTFLITNTKFSKGAIDYGVCAGLDLIGWNYPREGNLLDLVIETGVYPITVLTSLSKKEKKILMEHGIVLCLSFLEKTEKARMLGIQEKHIDAAVEEAGQLLDKNR